MLRYSTAGESHGWAIVAILEGIPSGLKVTESGINSELTRRQKGYGRGGRMRMEVDKARIVSGVRWGVTTGAPVCLVIENKDWLNNKERMSVDGKYRDDSRYVTRPRPGHADLSGMLKYALEDIRDVQERSSARETAARVAVGAMCKKFLEQFGISVYSYVEDIGGVAMKPAKAGASVKELFKLAEKSVLRCPDKSAELRMIELIDSMTEKGDTLGGKFCVIARHVPAGLGSYVQWDMKLDGRLAQAILSIQAIKGVEFGKGFELAGYRGSEAHDEIFYRKGKGYCRRGTNNAGGIEGGMSNGEDIVVRAVMKPIPTLRNPLRSVDVKTKEPVKGEIVRSDVCAVPACSVIAESVTGFEIAKVLLEKFAGDSMLETKQRYSEYIKYLKET